MIRGGVQVHGWSQVRGRREDVDADGVDSLVDECVDDVRPDEPPATSYENLHR